MSAKLKRGSSLCALVILAAQTAHAQNVVAERYDNARTGATVQALANGTLASTWSKQGVVPVQGNVYAQPLYAQKVAQPGGGPTRNMLFIATEANNIYGFGGGVDAATLAPVWTLNLGTNDKSKIGSDCDGISTDGIGIESTPVIDVASNRLYVSYRINPQNGADTADQMVVAIDLSTGKTVLGPTQINFAGFLSRWERIG